MHAFESDEPYVLFEHEGEEHRLDCDVIAGCDGFHGICRPAIQTVLHTFTREYPYGWLGILADVAPSSEELVYAHHARGFALLSLRSPTRSRLYIQCAPDENIDEWPDERIWEELQARTALDGLDARRRGRCSRRASPACAASSRSRCSTGACSSPATPRTSSRRRAPRA